MYAFKVYIGWPKIVHWSFKAGVQLDGRFYVVRKGFIIVEEI